MALTRGCSTCYNLMTTFKNKLKPGKTQQNAARRRVTNGGSCGGSLLVALLRGGLGEALGAAQRHLRHVCTHPVLTAAILIERAPCTGSVSRDAARFPSELRGRGRGTSARVAHSGGRPGSRVSKVGVKGHPPVGAFTRAGGPSYGRFTWWASVQLFLLLLRLIRTRATQSRGLSTSGTSLCRG